MIGNLVGRLLKPLLAAQRARQWAAVLTASALMIAGISATYAFQKVPDAAYPTVFGKGIRVNDVVLYVSMCETSRVGDKLPVWVSVQNEGAQQVYFGAWGMFPDSRFSAVDRRNGKEPTRTVFGKNVLDGVRDPTQHGIERLEKGQMMRLWAIDLAQCYEFTPGQYTFTLTLPMNSDNPKASFDITIKDIPFQITK